MEDGRVWRSRSVRPRRRGRCAAGWCAAAPMGVLRLEARGLPTLDGAAAGDADCVEPGDFGADAMERKVRGVGRLHPAPATEPSSYFLLPGLGVPEVGVYVLTRSSGGSPLSSLILAIFLVVGGLLL
jgi:hypothetical protein